MASFADLLDELDELAPMPERSPTPPRAERSVTPAREVEMHSDTGEITSFDTAGYVMLIRGQTDGKHDAAAAARLASIFPIPHAQKAHGIRAGEKQDFRREEHDDDSDVDSQLPDLQEENAEVLETSGWSELPPSRTRTRHMQEDSSSEREMAMATPVEELRTKVATDMSLDAVLERLAASEEAEAETDAQAELARQSLKPRRVSEKRAPVRVQDDKDLWRSPPLRKVTAERSPNESTQPHSAASDEEEVQIENSSLGAWRQRQKRVLEMQRAKRQAQPVESQRQVSHTLYRHHNLGGSRSVVPSGPPWQRSNGALKLGSFGGAGLARGFPGLPKMSLAGTVAHGSPEPAFHPPIRNDAILLSSQLAEGSIEGKLKERVEAASSAPSTVCPEAQEDNLPLYEDILAQLDAEADCPW